LEKEWKPLKSNDPVKLELIQRKIEQTRDAELNMLQLAKRRQEYLDQLLDESNDDDWKLW
jgi:glucose-6-phosphate isomerase